MGEFENTVPAPSFGVVVVGASSFVNDTVASRGVRVQVFSYTCTARESPHFQCHCSATQGPSPALQGPSPALQCEPLFLFLSVVAEDG